ncbi:MAG: class I SAM-dependent methyltransferase, partial [Acidobacteriota bacterium]
MLYNNYRRDRISFYKVISEFYDQIFPFSEKKKNFLQSLLGDKKGNYLDIGCATGDQVLFAEELGYSSYGLDNDLDLLRLAEKKKIEKGFDSKLISGDMRKAADLFRDIKFNTITCVGNTIAHLGSPLEIRGFFESMYELLDDGGAFAGQLV